MFNLSNFLGSLHKPVPMIRIAASDYRITGLHPKICAPSFWRGVNINKVNII